MNKISEPDKKVFWKNIIEKKIDLNDVIVSLTELLNTLDEEMSEGEVERLIRAHNVWTPEPLESVAQFAEMPVPEENEYSPKGVIALDKQLFDRFHFLLGYVLKAYPHFLDQLRYLHFMNMGGNEHLFLYPSQTKRLLSEGVAQIAGQVRTIQTGFGDVRCNGPRPEHLAFLLNRYASTIERLTKEVTEENVYMFVSFAQFYFAVIHPFYERCGRTSEELMYLLFAKTYPEKTKYISKTGWRSSPLAMERMGLINSCAEDFNKRIAECCGLNSSEIQKTPDLYRALTKEYFPDRFDEVYGVPQEKEYYYTHPISRVLELYHFAMESLLYEEMENFSLHTPTEHIITLGKHLEEKGHHQYTFQKENRKYFQNESKDS